MAGCLVCRRRKRTNRSRQNSLVAAFAAANDSAFLLTVATESAACAALKNVPVAAPFATVVIVADAGATANLRFLSLRFHIRLVDRIRMADIPLLAFNSLKDQTKLPLPFAAPATTDNLPLLAICLRCEFHSRIAPKPSRGQR